MSVSPFATVTELARALRERKVSSVELTTLYLRRLATLGKEHRAVVRLMEDTAMQAAQSSDMRRAAGRLLSPLDGIPCGVKDLFATEGVPTTWGVPTYANQIFNYDATVITRLKNAGAVIAAKLAMIQLAGGGNYNTPGASATGACLSAHDKTRWAGGSSSGSGAAAGLGCVGFAIGSETSGSITCPSCFNGVTGLRPTYGRVSRYGAMPLCWTLDKIGPMARSAEDCGLVLQVLAGSDPKDPTTLSERLNLRTRLGKVRVGLLPHDFAANKAEPMEKAYTACLELFRKFGWETVDVAYPPLSYGLAVQAIVNAEGASAHETLLRSQQIYELPDEDQVAGLLAALTTPAVDYLWAQRLRTQALSANTIWDKCDLIFKPTFYHAAVPAEGKFSQTWRNMGGDLGPANLLGWPAIAFPVGFEEGPAPLGRAPLGCQFLGPAGSEALLLAAAVRLQRETDWHRQHPS